MRVGTHGAHASDAPQRNRFLFGSSTAYALDFFCAADFGEASPAKNPAHRNSFTGLSQLSAILTAISATASTIQSKFSWPTEVISASGAGFRKSIAYGTPFSTANSTVLRSYPSVRHNVRASFTTRSTSLGSVGG